MSKTIMAVGAHTGDAQLTCGMLLGRITETYAALDAARPDA